ncbi:anti-sigma factor antagonist [Streptomyces sp. DSM 40750]|uniref:anti-sigma factor antagonist n=1 Tax=Streptomyces sp. DSM 40750 TaxID=2801030 RepID=UPI00214BC090|nr:anti-sigma factor antagonist [Streptomyces sp. DSM 40750]UUU19015.1 anti-sigma factor antagonist [Streptomyces sp. DSM 40750]UUU27643.1 anti-sigma factor antagonist [Streptomyces sp. DSM 40750]
MTIEWRYTVERDFGILSVSGYLGPDAVHRFIGAIGWVVGRGSGPVIVDLTGLHSWSTEGQLAIIEAARRLAAAGRSLELAAIAADDSLVPDGDCPSIPVHSGLASALAAHSARDGEPPQGRHEWRTTGWPSGDDAGA